MYTNEFTLVYVINLCIYIYIYRFGLNKFLKNIQIYDIVTKEYYLFPDNGAKNLLADIFIDQTMQTKL